VEFVPKDPELWFDQLNTYRVNDDHSYLLGDLYSGQKKSIVLEASFPAMAVGENHEIGTIEIKYMDVTTSDMQEKSRSIPVTIDVVSAADFQNETVDRAVTLESAFLLVAKAKSEGIKLADKQEFAKASQILIECAEMLEELKLNDSQLNYEIEALRQRARNLKDYGEDYYTIREKKRMFYESDKMAKANIASYEDMIARRKDDPF
jgi:hypothetical protein